MSKKKPPRNGFFYFMLDMQQGLREQGRDVSMRDMPIFAGPSWSKLSDAQKQCYSQRAKEDRTRVVPHCAIPASDVGSQSSASPDATKSGRRDCTGKLLSEACDSQSTTVQRMQEECQHIRSMFPAGREVTLEAFFFIDIQSLCYIPSKPEQRYLPCEIAVVKYSLSEGVISNYHCFIKPGPVPIGYRFLAQSTSNNTHQIPVEGESSAVRDYRLLLGKLESFLMKDRTTLPPLFAKRIFVERVSWSLHWLAESAGVTDRFSHVYEIENLISLLASHANCPKSPYAINDLLQTSNYDHDSCTRCDYHERLECTHCSLGISHTYCYIMSEFLCSMYCVSLTRNHLPIIPQGMPTSTCYVSSERSRRTSDMASNKSSVFLDDLPKGFGRGRGRSAYSKHSLGAVGRGHNLQ